MRNAGRPVSRTHAELAGIGDGPGAGRYSSASIRRHRWYVASGAPRHRSSADRYRSAARCRSPERAAARPVPSRSAKRDRPSSAVPAVNR
ncbi:hypothetical protein CIK06_16445 [Plantactinospora sp. KBS50]|nr:hypothetical protein [Plantactinospora sp. KBS50]ASW55419.1 hypothetical protein CIK06_16445 [Plantactinospora sp. KBS50]